MNKLKTFLKDIVIGFIIVAQVFLSPTLALAEDVATAADPADTSSQTQSAESTPAEENTTPTESISEPITEPTAEITASPPPEPPTPVGPTSPTGPQQPTGPTSPTGAASSTYTFNESTGLWENDKYTWDPVTKQTKPKTAQTYSYNPQTGMWDTTEWYFKPETGTYVANTVSVAQNPLAPVASNSITGTGPNSTNSINIGGTTNGTFDLFFDASVSNKIGQLSVSGNASVQGNTLGGNATSGDAETLLTLLNLLQSSWGQLGSQDIATFIANIDGNLVGDLYIDPSNIGGTGDSNIDVNVSNNSAIANDVDVLAQSGDANVSGNTTGGSALSGDARAIVNLINMINSAITANHSFVGVLNINGNFEGDILLPESLLQYIIASSGPSSSNTINSSDNDSLNVSLDTNRSIINNVSTDAASGSATVSNNTSAGGASSGNADTNILLLNLTGKQVVAKNAMLVFVNVLGSWVGLILDAPAGTNAVATTGPGSTNSITTSDNDNLNVNYTENSQIRNDIDASAVSGNATVASNTNAGGATSGDANVGVNIVNMIDSTFDISDWFGILFINVFGTWHGSFGVNTPYGNPAAASAGSGSSTSNNSPTATNANTVGSQATVSSGVFNFVPTNVAGQNTTNQVASATTSTGDNGSSNSANNATGQQPTTTAGITYPNVRGANWTWTIVGVSSAFTLLGIERFLTFRRRII
jgi:hypothetical protein